MSAIAQSLRDRAVYTAGYLKGSSSALPTSFTDLYATVASKTASLIALPLPFLSFLALPIFGGSSTAFNLLFFYLIWSALVLAHGQLWIEFWGTLAVRGVCFLLPAFLFLGFDLVSPSSVGRALNKAQDRAANPRRLGRDALLQVAGVAAVNVVLGATVQVALEFICTRVLRVRSIFRVSSIVPLPLNMLKHVLIGFVWRGIVHYAVHRYLLHTFDSQLMQWHFRWQHGVRAPFSLIAAYDHPANYLLAHWLPTFVPAVLCRFHVLTWFVFLAFVSFEELLLYSGYAILPSTIMLTGMARRTDEHFLSVNDSSKEIGNFGRWGVLDLVFRTTCRDESDIADDVEAEAHKHKLGSRVQKAAGGAIDGFQDVSDRAESKTKTRRKGKKRD